MTSEQRSTVFHIKAVLATVGHRESSVRPLPGAFEIVLRMGRSWFRSVLPRAIAELSHQQLARHFNNEFGELKNHYARYQTDPVWTEIPAFLASVERALSK